MLKIHYGASGRPINDFELEQEFQHLAQEAKGNTYTFSTENIFLRIRVAIRKKEISRQRKVFLSA